MPTQYRRGPQAPDFSLEDAGGSGCRRPIFKGKDVIVYFYPKDDTPGCHQGGVRLPRTTGRSSRRPASWLGVSATAPARTSNSREVQVPFPLLSDPDRKVMTAWGGVRRQDDVRQEDEGRHPLHCLDRPDAMSASTGPAWPTLPSTPPRCSSRFAAKDPRGNSCAGRLFPLCWGEAANAASSQPPARPRNSHEPSPHAGRRSLAAPRKWQSEWTHTTGPQALDDATFPRHALGVGAPFAQKSRTRGFSSSHDRNAANASALERPSSSRRRPRSSS